MPYTIGKNNLVELEPHAEGVFDPWSAPTAEVVSDKRRHEALEAFTEARKALGDGDLARAADLLARAAALDPTDLRYAAYVEQVAEEERRRQQVSVETPTLASPRPTAPRAGRLRTVLVGATLLLVVVAAFLATRPRGSDALPDLSAQHQDVAPFTRLSRAPGGGWIATVDEPLAALPAQDRAARCQAILAALPAAEEPSLLLRSTDGQALACQP
ncbi:hypothetical protein L6R53_07280 [Myxococcota bacterium]|nr:hypothetical protein [Myxococcota bacterium]